MIKKIFKALGILIAVVFLACVLLYEFSPDFRAGLKEGENQTKQK